MSEHLEVPGRRHLAVIGNPRWGAVPTADSRPSICTKTFFRVSSQIDLFSPTPYDCSATTNGGKAVSRKGCGR